MRKLFFLSAIIFVFACSDADKVPKDILPKQKMQAVLWDMIRAGEFLDIYAFRDTVTDRNAKALEWYDNIYRLHQVSKTAFQKSYAWYRDHPSLMKEVLDSLSKKQTAPPQPPPVTISDSVRRADSQKKSPNLLPDNDRLIRDSLKRKRLRKFTLQ
jgi:hypothetical protein